MVILVAVHFDRRRIPCLGVRVPLVASRQHVVIAIAALLNLENGPLRACDLTAIAVGLAVQWGLRIQVDGSDVERLAPCDPEIDSGRHGIDVQSVGYGIIEVVLVACHQTDDSGALVSVDGDVPEVPDESCQLCVLELQIGDRACLPPHDRFGGHTVRYHHIPGYAGLRYQLVIRQVRDIPDRDH